MKTLRQLKHESEIRKIARKEAAKVVRKIKRIFRRVDSAAKGKS